MDQEICFCTTSDGVRIAYAVAGKGPPLVKAPNWLTHLRFELETPVWRHWWEELTRDFTVIRFDQRGSGLSDWNVDDISLEAWVRDLEAVVEDVGVERFALLGISQGGAVAVEYAVRHPVRITHLVLCGAYVQGHLHRDRTLEEHEALMTLIREGWGRDQAAYRQLFTSQFMPDATREQMGWFNELQRASTSGENAARIQNVGSRINIVDLLPRVSAPTLVLHARGDLRVAFDQARQLASRIPNARLVALESNNHLTLQTEPAWQVLISEVRAFLKDEAASATASVAPGPPYTSVSALTPREIEVLRLIAEGRSNQQIAEELVISLNTVTNHVKNILSKTASANRTEAANYAFRHGLLPLPSSS
jgi:pimeloyl-ACP methyl ester carboxylesterase/DNA-binding CsgD family transcriptional regulator